MAGLANRLARVPNDAIQHLNETAAQTILKHVLESGSWMFTMEKVVTATLE